MNTKLFETVVREAHGFNPDPWQIEFYEDLLREGYDHALRQFTGAGKTIALDALVCATAKQLIEGAELTDVPYRFFYTINRRTVVDQTYGHVQELIGALQDPQSDIVAQAGDVLSNITSQRWRGGLQENNALPSPDQPCVIVSTVDQVGSRLLMSGYGNSNLSDPIYGGFVGNHSVVVLDEAHISRPFSNTLEFLRDFTDGQTPHYISMSATLQDPDWEPDSEPSGRIQRIRNTVKRATDLKVGDTTSDTTEETREAIEKGCLEGSPRKAEGAIDYIERGIDRVGIIVNRVNSVKRITEQLRNHNCDHDIIALVGRARPHEKQKVRDRLRDLKDNDRIVVVATQTIEIGVDIDFGAMVTEIAPLDALIQRFGRLDRRGERGDVSATVVTHKKHDRASHEDPIYGNDLSTTYYDILDGDDTNFDEASDPSGWNFGWKGWTELVKYIGLLENSHSPLLQRPQIFDSIPCTSRGVEPHGDVSYLLRGQQDTYPEVSVVWRANLDEHASEKIRKLPPRQYESIQLPIWTVKRWLSEHEQAGEELSDQIGGHVETEFKRRDNVWIWDGKEVSKLQYESDMSPGDTIVVPTEYGGHGEFFFNPSASGPVSDIAEEVPSRDAVRLTEWEEDEPPEPSDFDLPDKPGGWSVESYGQDWICWRFPETSDRQKARERIGLESHCRSVAGRVQSYCELLGLDDIWANTLHHAALYHDIGKADPRWQAWVQGGHIIHSTPLAKSAVVSRSGDQEVREASGLERGSRHELGSAQLLEQNRRLIDDLRYPELAIYLVATHHGWGRPSYPDVGNECREVSLEFGGECIEGTIDFNSADSQYRRFEHIHGQFSPWKIAHLEYILRMADMEVSADGR